jgi:hypothetical protein
MGDLSVAVLCPIHIEHLAGFCQFFDWQFELFRIVGVDEVLRGAGV